MTSTSTKLLKSPKLIDRNVICCEILFAMLEVTLMYQDSNTCVGDPGETERSRMYDVIIAPRRHVVARFRYHKQKLFAAFFK
jgi:hypothetical protein